MISPYGQQLNATLGYKENKTVTHPENVPLYPIITRKYLGCKRLKKIWLNIGQRLIFNYCPLKGIRFKDFLPAEICSCYIFCSLKLGQISN